MSKHNKPLHEVILDRRLIDNAGCWNYTGPLDTDGYGQIGQQKDGKYFSYRIHRLAYEAWVGPIPDGLLVCHTCDNRRCFNPEHLFTGTRTDNHTDMENKQRQPRGESHKNHVITEEVVRGLRSGSLKPSKQLALQLGCNYYHLYAIKNGDCWKHITC